MYPATFTSDQADALEQQLRQHFNNAMIYLGMAPEFVEDAITGFFSLGLLPRWMPNATPQQQAAAANLQHDYPRIDTWATKYRAWAEQGHKDTGTAYSWQDWADYYNVILEDVDAQSGYAHEGSDILAASDAIAATAEEIADPSLWPTWLKGGLFIGGAIVLFIVAAPMLRAGGGGLR